MLIARLAIASLLALTLPAVAAGVELRKSPQAVLELFTSQGCSSCPQADALLRQLGERPEIIALAYHVDYWDYIGWPDTFGNEENSDRQRAYAERWGSSRIFTPQMIVNGNAGVVASRRDEVHSALDVASLQLAIDLRASGDMLEVSIDDRPDLEAAVIWLVTFIDRADVAIDGGENEGRRIAYTQIVTGRQALGVWEPGAELRLKLPLTEILTEPANGLVIMVQSERDGLPGPILGAASYQR